MRKRTTRCKDKIYNDNKNTIHNQDASELSRTATPPPPTKWNVIKQAQAKKKTDGLESALSACVFMK